MCSLTMKHVIVVTLNARQMKGGVYLIDTKRVCFNEHNNVFLLLSHMLI